MKRRVICSAFCSVVIAGVVLYPFGAFAQRRPTDGSARVAYDRHGPARSRSRALRFGSVAEAEAAVDRILKVAGLTRNFVIEASDDVDNAEAGVDGNNRRYIYYNPAFMERLKNRAQTDWAAAAIMAHEIGHHLLGHRTDDEGQTPQEEEAIRRRQELEADKYSGFILRYMGASISEAQSAIDAYGSPAGSRTHPPARQRVEAVRAGWEEATSIIKGLVAAEEGRAAGRTAQPAPQRAAPEAPRARTAPAVPRISARNTSARLSRDRWSWSVFIDAAPEVLDQVNCVVYQLHPTFRPSEVRVCERGDARAFALTAVGWGTFQIRIQVLTKDGRQYDLSHALRL